MEAIPPEEVADLIRRTCELQHDLQLVRARLEDQDGPLAAVAAAAARSVESTYEDAAEALRAAAPVMTLVTLD